MIIVLAVAYAEIIGITSGGPSEESPGGISAGGVRAFLP